MPSNPSLLFALLASGASALTFFAASDTHLGHDPGVGANKTTSYTKNVWAINVRDTGRRSARRTDATLTPPPPLLTIQGDELTPKQR